MNLVSFTSTDAPEGHRGLAMFMDGPTTFHPVHASAPTEAEARVKLQTWWDAQLEKERAKQANLAARNEKLRKKAA